MRINALSTPAPIAGHHWWCGMYGDQRGDSRDHIDGRSHWSLPAAHCHRPGYFDRAWRRRVHGRQRCNRRQALLRAASTLDHRPEAPANAHDSSRIPYGASCPGLATTTTVSRQSHTTGTPGPPPTTPGVG